MPTVAEMVADRDDRIDFTEIERRYPWLYEQGQNCIISPDSDGLLCGLLMSHYLNWKIRGFYDGKVLVVDQEVSARDCVFLDMEIFRSGVRGIGQHMLLYNKNQPPDSWSEFDTCFSINNFRGHDGLHDFRLKYPFATVHFLMVVLNPRANIPVGQAAIAPLLFTDGTYHNLFRYTENSLDWLRYLRFDEEDNPLAALFRQDRYTIVELMRGMNDFWRARDQISDVPGERGDRVAISIRGDEARPHNLQSNGETYRLAEDAKRRAELFIGLLERATGWRYEPDFWSWKEWNLRVFVKASFQSEQNRLNGNTFQGLIARRPLSFAMTSGTNYEFTLDPEGLFPDI